MKKQKLLVMVQGGGVEGSYKGSGPVGVVSTPPSEAHSQPAEEESESELHGLKCSAPLREVGWISYNFTGVDMGPLISQTPGQIAIRMDRKFHWV